jgi:crotonobetainyl-CoA:carnitine CoA-transferase CaiB-like acyl-CoA transferase
MTEALLDELLVIDASRGGGGGYCCLLFAQLGAEALKITAPCNAHGTGIAGGGRTEVLPYIESDAYVDAGKKSITLDPSRPEGAALLQRLAGRADVLVSDGVLPPALDYATLSAQNPRLILTRVTPSKGDGLFADYFAGLNAFAATLLPLVNMAILGRGQEIEVDAAECLAAAAFLVDGGEQWPQSEAGDAPPPPPFRVTGQAEGPSPAAPSAGEPRLPAGRHNDEVYCGLLGLSGEEMARLKEASVI